MVLKPLKIRPPWYVLLDVKIEFSPPTVDSFPSGFGMTTTKTEVFAADDSNIQYFVSDINQVQIQGNTRTGYITHVEIPRTCQL